MFGFTKPVVDTDPEKIRALLSRGVERIFPSTNFLAEKMIRGERVTLYLGIDPTGPTLHLGHLIPLLKLSEFQKMGHQIILLIGDFTAMIGDPTDKQAVRKKLTKEEVEKNLMHYRTQLSRFISFEGDNKALFKFNSEWLEKMNFADVLELSSLMTVDQMLKRDMFQKRAEEGKPVYIHEFMYPLMQGYDSVAMDVDGEIGGNDQTFNMLVGRDFLKALKNKEKFVIAMKLLTDSTGKKMGKTENNMVALNQTPSEMFGRVMSWGDEFIVPALRIVTQLPEEDILALENALHDGENPKNVKMRLAKEIVSLCCGEARARLAQEDFERTFSQGATPENIQKVIVSQGTELVTVLLAEGIVESKTEFRRLIEAGAISKGEEKISGNDVQVQSGVYKIGKRRFIELSVE